MFLKVIQILLLCYQIFLCFWFLFRMLKGKVSISQKAYYVSLVPAALSGILCTVSLFFSWIFRLPAKDLFSENITRIVVLLLTNVLLASFFSLTITFCRPKGADPRPAVLPTAGNVLYLILFVCLFFLESLMTPPAVRLLLISLLLLLLFFFSLALYSRLSAYSLQLENLQAKEKMIKTQQTQIEDLQAMYTKMLKLQHDTKAFVRDMQEAGVNEKETVPEYLKLMEEKLQPLPSTGNPALDSVLSIKVEKIKKRGIEFRGTNLHYTGGMNITDVSLCSLIANMLDNALEALYSASGKIENPFIYLGFSYSAAGLMIICENPVDPSPEPREAPVRFLFTTKKEPGHGLGTSIMKKVVEDAGGQIDFLKSSGTFRVLATIPQK